MAKLISQSCGDLQLAVCPGEMEPFKDHLSTHGHLTSLTNKPAALVTFNTNICLNC